MIPKEYEENWCDKLTPQTINDIKEDSILRFYESTVECGRLPEIGFDKDSLMIKHGLLRNGHLTNTGVMLFGKTNPITLK